MGYILPAVTRLQMRVTQHEVPLITVISVQPRPALMAGKIIIISALLKSVILYQVPGGMQTHRNVGKPLPEQRFGCWMGKELISGAGF